MPEIQGQTPNFLQLLHSKRTGHAEIRCLSLNFLQLLHSKRTGHVEIRCLSLNFVILLMLAGFALRAYNLPAQSVWYDEWISVSHTGDPDVATCIRTQKPANWNMVPVYYALQYFWANSVGDSIVTVRLLSVLFSVLTIPLLYLAGRTLFGRHAGLIAALCFTLSGVHIYQGQEIRNYALTMLFSAASLYTFAMLIQRPTRTGWILHCAANVLLIWTHLFGCFLLVAQGLFLLFARRLRKPTVAWFVANGLLVLPSFLWIRTIKGSTPDILPPAPWQFVNNAVADCWSGMLYYPISLDWTGLHVENLPPRWTKPFIDTYVYADNLLLVFFLLCVAYLGFRLLWRTPAAMPDATESSRREGFWLLLSCWLVPPLVLFALAWIWRPDCFSPKYTTYSSLSLYVLAGGALAQIPKALWRRAAVLVLLALFAHRTVLTVTENQRTDWQSATRYVRELAGNDDVVLVIGDVQAPVCQYHLRETSFSVRRPLTYDDLCMQTEEILGQHKVLWLLSIVFHNDVFEPWERYLCLRRIAFDKRMYWSAQLPMLVVYRIGPDSGHTPVAEEAAAGIRRNASADYEDTRKAVTDARALLSAGQRRHALEIVRAAFERTPWDSEIFGLYLTLLEQDPNTSGEIPEVLRRTIAYLTKDGLPPLPSKDRKAIDLGVLLLDAYDRAVGWHIWNDKDPNAALDLARIELAYAPDHAPAHANAGQAHVLKGDRVRAIESFQRAIAIDPQKSGACYASLARLFALEGDFQRAAETARQGLRRYPDDPALAPLLIENLARMGDVKGAISAFRSVVTKPKVAEAAYDTLAVTLQANPAHRDMLFDATRIFMKKHPDHPGALARLGEALSARGDSRQAAAAYARAAELDPDRFGWCFLRAAENLATAKAWARLANLCRTGLKKQPESAPLNGFLVQSLAMQDKMGEALKAFEAAVRAGPAGLAAYDSLIGILSGDRYDPDTIIKTSRLVVERYPKNAKAHRELGIALRAKGDRGGALSALRASVELDPADSRWTYGALASLLLEEGDAQAALDAATRGLALLPADPLLLQTKGLAHRALRQYGEAVASLRQCVEQKQAAVSVYWDLALAQTAAHDNTGAIESAHRAFDGDPGLAASYRALFDAVVANPDPMRAENERARLRAERIAIPHELCATNVRETRQANP